MLDGVGDKFRDDEHDVINQNTGDVPLPHDSGDVFTGSLSTGCLRCVSGLKDKLTLGQ
ncbi:hypothetical protein SMA5143A_8036 [Streptomyces sp. MA5143a]|nr:hypothetical protein SMA5143A_8036 [Streptomyces sp. MA5143a]